MFTLLHLFECFCYSYEGHDNDRCPKHGVGGRVVRAGLVVIVLVVAGLVVAALVKGA